MDNFSFYRIGDGDTLDLKSLVPFLDQQLLFLVDFVKKTFKVSIGQTHLVGPPGADAGQRKDLFALP